MKQFIEKLRAWKKAYDVFPSMAADREFQEMLDGFTPSNDEVGYSGIKCMIDILNDQIKTSTHGDLTEFGEGSIFFLKEMKENAEHLYKEELKRLDSARHPAPTDRQEALAEIAFRYGYGLSYYPGELAMSGKPHQYNIALTHGHGRHALHLVCGSTYAAAESAARLWLEKLADKEEGK